MDIKGHKVRATVEFDVVLGGEGVTPEQARDAIQSSEAVRKALTDALEEGLSGNESVFAKADLGAIDAEHSFGILRTENADTKALADMTV